MHPATVELTFPDEKLPWPTYLPDQPMWPAGVNPPAGRDPEAPTQLVEYPNYPHDLNGSFSVPWCDNPNTTAATLPSGYTSCIKSVVPSIPEPSENADYDAGTLTLLVQGSGTGDPGYAG